MYLHQRDTLENGLRVVSVEMPHLHTAALVAYIKVGSRYEQESTSGISHFLEHMLFRGTKSFPDSYQLNDAIEQLGGSLNAATCRDYTYFETRLPKESIAEGVRILSEIFTSPRFVKLETERQAVLEELSSDLDDNGNLICVDSISRLALFPAHPLGMPIIGHKDNIERFAKADVQTHFRRHYTAKNIILCGAGQLSHADLLDAAKRFLGKLPAGEEHAVTTPALLPVGPHFSYTENPGSQTQLSLAFRTVGDQHPDFVGMQLLWRILDDGMGARLHRRIYDDLGLAYEISAGLDPYFDIGVFDVDAAVRHENAPALLREVLRLLAELRDQGPSEAELNKAKKRYALDLKSTLDSPEGMAGWFGGTALFLQPEDFAQRIDKVNNFSVADVQRISREIFTPQNLFVTAVGDLKNALVNKCRAAVEAGF
jgi:predicted Zn-dependent peptidase